MTSLHVLALVAVLELAVNRVVVPMTRPVEPALWHTCLDYLGLFFFYFTGTLAALIIGVRVAAAFSRERPYLERLATVSLGVAALLAAIPLVVTASETVSATLEVAFALAVLIHVGTVFDRRRDLGVQVGLAIIAVPLLFHSASALGAHFLWPDRVFDGPSVDLERDGVIALCIAALATPYLLRAAAVRARRHPAGAGGVRDADRGARCGHRARRLSRGRRGGVARDRRRDEQGAGRSEARAVPPRHRDARVDARLVRDRRHARAPWHRPGARVRRPRRLRVSLAGALSPAAARAVADCRGRAHRARRGAEATPIVNETPPISDSVWAAYLAAVTQGLRDTLGEVNSLTTRGEGGLMSSVIVGTANGSPCARDSSA